MKKLLRIAKESFFALIFYKTPLTYLKSRLGLFKNKKITVSLNNGISYVINAGTTEIRVIDEIWRLRVYDPLLSFVASGATVIDIGANIGVFSVKAARHAKDVKVLSFEPFPRNFEMLKGNIGINHLDNFIYPVRLAVSGKKEEKTLYFRPHDSGGASLKRYGDESELSSITVQTTTLEDIFRDHHVTVCDFLKVDCEGAEEEILTTAPRLMFDRIRSLTIEWHQDLNKMTLDEFLAFLGGLGYQTKYNPSTLTTYAWK